MTRIDALMLSLFFFNDTATTEIYTLSLHDALPISRAHFFFLPRTARSGKRRDRPSQARKCTTRSEEHTSELQSPDHLVCRLLLEKKKNKSNSERTTNRYTTVKYMSHVKAPRVSRQG